MEKTEWNGIERRQSQRSNLKVPLRVFLVDTEVYIGHVVDVSLHGMRVLSSRPLDGEQPLSFDLELPDSNGREQKAPVTAVGVYSKLDADSGGYFTGFKFLSIKPETIFSLQRLTDELVPFS